MDWGLYLADQHWERTQSKGIYTYSRLLAREVCARLPEPPLLVVNRANREDMVPSPAVPALVLSPRLASGFPRLFGDQVLAPLLAWRRGLSLLHFPKGFVPWVSPPALRLTATVHDLIPLYYAQRHPGHFSGAKLAYLRRAILTTLRRCHAVMTDSHFSRQALLSLAAEHGLRPQVEVCPPAPDPALTDPPWAEGRDPRRLVHIGSVLPHKRTPETIRRFRRWAAGRSEPWCLHVVGLGALPREWRIEPGPDLVLRGALSRAELRRALGEARALLLLSEIEGFGLPALEAWFVGTPVCYAEAGSLPEVLEGCPGRWAEDAPLDGALSEVLGLGEEAIATHRDRLRARFGIEAFGARAASLLAGWRSDRPGDGSRKLGGL